MPYMVMVTRPTDRPDAPEHRFKMSDEDGQPMTFQDQAQAQQARDQHLARFPSDRAEVVPAGEAESA